MSAAEAGPAGQPTDRPARGQSRLRRLVGFAALAFLALVALYAAAGFWWLPRLVEKDLPPWLAQRYGLHLAIGTFRFDPFRFAVEADDLALRAPGGGLLLQAERATVDFEPTELLRRTWRFDRIVLTGLQLRLVLAKDGSLDLIELLHRLVPPSGTPAADPPRLVVDRLEAVRAGLLFTDLRGPVPAKASITPIDIRITGLSTLPGSKASHRLSAGLPDAGTLRSEGELVLAPAPSARGKVEVRGLQAASCLPFLRNALPIDRLQGSADLSAAYAYSPAAGLRLDGIGVRLADLLLAARGVQAPLIEMKQIDASGGSVDRSGHAVAFERLTLAHGTVSVSVDGDGRVGWSRLAPPRQAQAPAQAPEPAWRLALAAVRLDQVALDYADRRLQPPLVAKVGSVDAGLQLTVTTGAQPDLTARSLALRADAVTLPAAAPGSPALRLDRVDVEGGSMQLGDRQVSAKAVTVEGGSVSIARAADGPMAASVPSGAPWAVRIDALKLERIAAHYADSNRPALLRLDLDRIDVAMALQLSAGGATTQFSANGIQAQLQAATLAIDTQPPGVLTLAAAALKDGRFDLAKQQLGAAEVALTGGAMTILRDAHGKVDLLDSFGAGRTLPTAPAPPSGWQYTLDTLKLQRFAIRAEDRSFGAPLALAGQLDATVRHLAQSGEAAFDARLSLADEHGSIDATGTAALSTGDLQAHVVATAIALEPLQPLLARHTVLALQTGQAGADMQLSHASGALVASGRFDFANLALTEAGTNTNVLSFDQLAGRQVDYSSRDQRLTIGAMELRRPVTKIAIAKDHSVNLGQWIRRGDGAATRPASAGAPRPAAAASAPALAVAVQRITVHDGSVDFADQSLILPFTTKVTAIEATIAGSSNASDRRADVQASGSIQTYGSASVEGSIVPTAPRNFTDLRVKFNNVLLAPFSPYTATFAGRKVESGKLWLELAYKVDRGELNGSNDIRLKDFTLGERVESSTALDIPLDLAVSLLTDSHGEIQLSVPVQGNLKDPHFKIGDAIAHAVGNTLSRIVTAPFRLIGRLFGGGQDSLASIDFAPGSATLAPEQREKLDALIRALRERPLLKLVVGAPYDERADTLALQEAETRRQLAARLERSDAADGSGSQLVAFDDEATRQALRAMRPPESAPAVASADEANAANAAKAADAADAADAANDRAGYEALFERIAKQQNLGAGALQELAGQRAARIADYLTGQGVDSGRVQRAPVQAVQGRGGATVDATLTVAATSAPR